MHTRMHTCMLTHTHIQIHSYVHAHCTTLCIVLYTISYDNPDLVITGVDWYRAFKSRNPTVAERVSHKHGRQRAAVTMQQLDAWYKGVSGYLEEEVPDWQQLLGDPRRIFNADESGFPLSVTSGRVLTPRGVKHVYQVVSSTKQQLTVMMGMNAMGDYPPPMIVHPGKGRTPEAICGMEDFEEAIHGQSLNGWMDSELFLTYLAHFHKFIVDKHIPKPVILFVDGHSTHMTHESAQFCADNNIILYCLPPNATHIMHPCDVGLFSPLKAAWESEVKAWQMSHLGEVITKNNFAGVFKRAWERVSNLTNSVSAFKRSGLFPLTIQGIDISKLTMLAIPGLNISQDPAHVPPNQL